MNEREKDEHEHVEKSTMDAPQEEFIADESIPSVTKKEEESDE